MKNLNAAKLDDTTEVVISPPALYLTLTRELANPKIGVAAQNVYDKPNGAFTGEISVEQLRDTKINWAVIGHSERRVILKETDEVCITAVLRIPDLQILEPEEAQANHRFNSSLPARPRPPLKVVFLSSSALERPLRYVIHIRILIFVPIPIVGHREKTGY